MAAHFEANGVSALAVHSGNDSVQRDRAIEALRQGAVRILFVVDLFNEGVDIPHVDQVLFLRPTESMTVFLQQLGRGLRLHPGKRHLTVLDFIGNYRNAHYKLVLLAGKEGDFDPADAAKAVRALAARTLGASLPAGIELHFDLQTIDLLKTLARQREPLQQRLIAAFEEQRHETGRRPTLLELHRHGRHDVCQYRKLFGGWYRFLSAVGQLREEEAAIHVQADATTLVAGFRRVFADPRHRRDLCGTPVVEMEKVSDERLRAYLDRNPLAAWTNPGTGARPVYFEYDRTGGAFRYTGPEPTGMGAFHAALRERIEYRLEEYFERRFERRNVYEVVRDPGTSDRAWIRFGSPEGNPDAPNGAGWVVVIIDGQRMYARFDDDGCRLLKDRPEDGESKENCLTRVLEGLLSQIARLKERNRAVRIAPSAEDEGVWFMERA